jgi:hypothetical protein
MWVKQVDGPIDVDTICLDGIEPMGVWVVETDWIVMEESPVWLDVEDEE